MIIISPPEANIARNKEAIALLKALYPDAKPALEFSSPFELLMATMLSAQCTDKQVNKVTRVLFKAHNTPEAIASLEIAELEGFIMGCGLYKTKAANMVATSRLILEGFGGNVPQTIDELIKLPGVGRKTANVVASNAFNVDAIAVDTHVFRVANRLGLASAKNVSECEAQLMGAIDKSDWSLAHHLLIYHGRNICLARKPKCTVCTLEKICSAAAEGKCNS